MLIDAKDIAAELQLARAYVVRRVLTRPDFPRPALELSRKVRKWSREEFERWLSDHYRRK
jgi:predicted DNA-binding transcriptional regulator AlpA